jgi:hypothetical protein
VTPRGATSLDLLPDALTLFGVEYTLEVTVMLSRRNQSSPPFLRKGGSIRSTVRSSNPEDWKDGAL